MLVLVWCCRAEARDEQANLIAAHVAADAAVLEAQRLQYEAEAQRDASDFAEAVAEAQLAAANQHIAHLASRVQLLADAMEHAMSELQNTHRAVALGTYPPAHTPRGLAAPAAPALEPVARRLIVAEAGGAFVGMPRVNDTAMEACGDACVDVTAGLNCTHDSECTSFQCVSRFDTNVTNATCYEWWMDCMVDHSNDPYFAQPRFLASTGVALHDGSTYYPIKCDLGPPARCLQEGVCDRTCAPSAAAAGATRCSPSCHARSCPLQRPRVTTASGTRVSRPWTAVAPASRVLSVARVSWTATVTA